MLMNKPSPVSIMELLLKCHQTEKEIAVAGGVSVDELHCLSQIYIHTPYCVKKLSELLRVPPSRTSRLLGALEERGYLTRSLSTPDRRKEQITLTDAGVRLAEFLQFQASTEAEHLVSSLAPELTQFAQSPPTADHATATDYSKALYHDSERVNGA